MQTLKLSVQDDIFENFMGFINMLPKEKVTIEAIDDIPTIPAISYEEACMEVKEAFENIHKNEGVEADKFFEELLSK